MVAVNYLWNPINDNIVREFDDAGNTIAEYTTEPELYGNVVSQFRNGQTSYLVSDGQGNTTELTNDAGNVTDTIRYSAFGKITQRTGSTEIPLQYVGQLGYFVYSLLGNVIVRHRAFAPDIQRWLSKDPLQFRTPSRSSYTYGNNNPLTAFDPSGKAVALNYTTRVVAKSFINGIPIVGALFGRLGPTDPIPPFMVKPEDPNAIVPFETGATERLEIIAALWGVLPAFNQNPFTDAKDQTYRLYTRVDISFCCDRGRLLGLDIQADMDGGFEAWVTAPGLVPLIPFFVPIYGTINMEGPHVTRTKSSASIWWWGYGRPNIAVEPTFNWVAYRTSVNIWHEPAITVACKGNRGTHRVDSFTGSLFPSHKLWVNGALTHTRVQTALSALWNADPAGRSFVQ